MNEKRRYKKSKVRDKQPLVRSLKTFSNQYKYIYCENEYIDFNEEPVSLHFSDEYINDFYLFISNDDLIVNLKDYSLICEAIDDMFGIGETDWKEELKKEILECGGEDLNYFLNDNYEFKAKEIILRYSTNKKIYTYIKNYVSFFNSGVYGSTKRDKLSIKPIIFSASIEKRLDFLLKAKKLYLRINDEIQSKHDMYEDEIYDWMKNPNFDIEALHKDNDSYFHPIDDSTQSDTLYMIERKKGTMYNKDTMENVHNWDSNIGNEINHMIKELDNFSKVFNIKVDFKKLRDFENFEIPRFEDTYCWDLLDNLRTELIEFKESKEEFKKTYKEFLDFSKKQLEEYDIEWLKEQLQSWEHQLYNSKYFHKVEDIEKYIINAFYENEDLINKFKELIHISRRILLEEVDFYNLISQLDEILDMDYFEEDEENYIEKLTDDEIFYRWQTINLELQKKDDYQLSDINYLIQKKLVKSEDEYNKIKKRASIYWNKLIEDDINIF